MRNEDKSEENYKIFREANAAYIEEDYSKLLHMYELQSHSYPETVYCLNTLHPNVCVQT